MEPIRILLAHPDSGPLSTYRDYLSRGGMVVVTATGWPECLVQLYRFRPHALVLDMDLPGDGWAGPLARLRQGCDLPSPPAVILSSRSGEFGPVALGWPIVGLLVSPAPAALLAGTIR